MEGGPYYKISLKIQLLKKYSKHVKKFSTLDTNKFLKTKENKNEKLKSFECSVSYVYIVIIQGY